MAYTVLFVCVLTVLRVYRIICRFIRSIRVSVRISLVSVAYRQTYESDRAA